MKRKPVLLLAKKSFFEKYGLEYRDPHFLALMKSDSEVAQSLRQAHEENLAVVESVEQFLLGSGINYVKSDVMSRQLGDGAEVVLSVGGDGTLLMASHGVQDTPVVGINSRPGVSVGHFCAADRQDFQEVLDLIFSGRMQPRTLHRMDLQINGQPMSPPALNDLLYASENPAASTVFSMDIDGKSPMQRSSGIWFATAAGSTAGIRAAGGSVMELPDARMQFLVREPYYPRGEKAIPTQGYFQESFAVTNLTPHAAIYVDGSRIVHRLLYGDRIQPRISPHPLRIYL